MKEVPKNGSFDETSHTRRVAGIVSARRCAPPPRVGVGSYKMLHLVTDVKRNDPPQEKRAPNSIPISATDAYRQVARRVFSDDSVQVSSEVAHGSEAKPTLQEIEGRRKKYSGDIE